MGTVTSVDSGAGLTGGPITSSGTLAVGAGYGITVTADAVEVTNSEIQAQANIAIGNNTTDNLAEGTNNKYWSTTGNAVTTTYLPEGTNLYYTDARVEAYLSGNTSTINADTITANAFVGGTFSGEGSDLTDVRAETIEATVKNISGVAIDKGYPLHVVSATGGGTPEVILADAGNASTMPAHFIAGEDLAIDAEGTRHTKW